MLSFIENNKVPFNSVKNLVVKRHLYFDFENMTERRSIAHAISLLVYYLKILVIEIAQEIDHNSAKLKDNRPEGKFVSKNVINLSQRQLTKSETSRISKGLKFVPTPCRVDKTKRKQELEVFGRKIRLMWRF